MGRRSWLFFAVVVGIAGCWTSREPTAESGLGRDLPPFAGGRSVTPSAPRTPREVNPPVVAGASAPSVPSPSARPPTAPPTSPSRPPAARPIAGTTGSLPGVAGTFAGSGTGGVAAQSGGRAGAAANGGRAGRPSPPEELPPRLPAPTEPCPTLATGTVKLRGSEVRLWVGAASAEARGPVLIYWHGGGSAEAEVMSIGSDAMREIMNAGGVVAAPLTSNLHGQTTGVSWYTGDFDVADELVACASQQLNIDSRRIYSLGSLSGALQASAMAFLRSDYVAAIVSNSGGLAADWPSRGGSMPAALALYGENPTELVIVDFATTSRRLSQNLTASGGFAIECEHPGNPTQAPAALVEAAWRFLIDHPYGVRPQPYAAGLPAVFPDYCLIVR